MKKFLRLSVALLSGVGIGISTVFAWQLTQQHITVFDTPKILSNHEETIEVSYIRWACDCANWLPDAAHTSAPDYELQPEDCIFIEPASSDIIIPESFFENSTNTLRITGKYYQDRGIARRYDMKTPDKPERARVFRYYAYKIISNR